MGWQEEQEILRKLVQLQTSVDTIKKSEKEVESTVKELISVVTALDKNQVGCCNMLNKKLDQLIAALIKPPPKEPAGFTAFLSE